MQISSLHPTSCAWHSNCLVWLCWGINSYFIWNYGSLILCRQYMTGNFLFYMSFLIELWSILYLTLTTFSLQMRSAVRSFMPAASTTSPLVSQVECSVAWDNIRWTHTPDIDPGISNYSGAEGHRLCCQIHRCRSSYCRCCGIWGRNWNCIWKLHHWLRKVSCGIFIDWM